MLSMVLGITTIATLTGVILAGASIGAMSMLLYGKLSPQGRVAQLSVQIAEARAALSSYDEVDARVLWSKAKHAIGLSLEQIKLILLPTLCAALPVLGFAWLVDNSLDLSSITLAPGWQPDWLFSGHVAFWLPLTLAAVAVKWKYEIK